MGSDVTSSPQEVEEAEMEILRFGRLGVWLNNSCREFKWGVRLLNNAAVRVQNTL